MFICYFVRYFKNFAYPLCQTSCHPQSSVIIAFLSDFLCQNVSIHPKKYPKTRESTDKFSVFDTSNIQKRIEKHKTFVRKLFYKVTSLPSVSIKNSLPSLMTQASSLPAPYSLNSPALSKGKFPKT